MDKAMHYEIQIAGQLSSDWSEWFDGLAISASEEKTLICGLIPDQAALYGLIARVRDLGLVLISVKRIDELAEDKK